MTIMRTFRPVRKGDIVTVCMARGRLFDFHTGMWIYRVTVLSTPMDTGDTLWYFRVDGEKGVEFAVSQHASDFIGLILEADGEG